MSEPDGLLGKLFDEKALIEARAVQELEEWLMELSEGTFVAVRDSLARSIFVKDPQRVKQLCTHIIFAVSKRYMAIPIYSRLACALYDMRSADNALADLHQVFFTIIIPKQVD